MAGPFDFTGQNIEDSYQRVLQTDGTLIYDGTGSLFTIPGNIDTGSFVTTGSFNSYTGSNTSQFAGTASFVQNAQTASYVQNAVSASYVLNAVSSSFATTASFAVSASRAVSSSFATTASVATILQTARTIGGVSFNGSANINLPGVNTSGNQNTSGNAATATLATNVIVDFSSSAATLQAAFPTVRFFPIFGAVKTGLSVDYYYVNSGSFQYILGTNTLTVTSSYANQALSSSFAISSSFATTASFVKTAQTASFVLSSSFATTASYILNAVSSSFASTASFVNPLTQTVIINGKLIQTGSHAQGFNTNTAGNYSHAEGVNTFSTGNYSHAEGSGGSSTGESSHAEGYSTTAAGQFSHAEGYGTTATGASSHAEGGNTTAAGDASHAEGDGAAANGAYSHAEGAATTATGNYSHAEGANTTAGQLGYDPVTSITSGVFELNSGYSDLTSLFSPGVFVLIDDVMGEINGTPNIFKLEVLSSTYTGTFATEITLVDTSINTSGPKYSVGIYGDFNPTAADVPIGSFSHTSGESTHTVGNGSSAKGTSTEALGYYSHAEGRLTTAIGYASHAEGYGTITNGFASHAEGWGTVASGSYQHVQGQYNLASSAQSAFIVGNGTADNARSNLIFASGSTLQITGSLIVSGSGTFINIGPAIFSGSVTSTAGFTGSLQGTVTTASYAQTASFVQTAQTASFSQTASYVTGSIFTTGNRALSASYAITASFVPGTIGGSGTAGAIAKFSGTATVGNATADTDYLINSIDTIAYTAMGSTIKGNGVIASKPHNMASNASLPTGSVYFTAYYLSKAATITGVKWWQGTLSTNTTGSFGLYSVSAGTASLQASSSPDSTIFTTNASTFKSKAFISTYNAPAGLYYIGVITTGGNSPSIGANAPFKLGGGDFTNGNSFSLVRTGAATLPSTQVLNAIVENTTATYGLFLY